MIEKDKLENSQNPKFSVEGLDSNTVLYDPHSLWESIKIAHLRNEEEIKH